MTPAAHSSSAIFVELGLALFLKGGSRGLEERTLTVRDGTRTQHTLVEKMFQILCNGRSSILPRWPGQRPSKLFYLQPFPHKITNIKANSHC